MNFLRKHGKTLEIATISVFGFLLLYTPALGGMLGENQAFYNYLRFTFPIAIFVLHKGYKYYPNQDMKGFTAEIGEILVPIFLLLLVPNLVIVVALFLTPFIGSVYLFTLLGANPWISLLLGWFFAGLFSIWIATFVSRR